MKCRCGKPAMENHTLCWLCWSKEIKERKKPRQCAREGCGVFLTEIQRERNNKYCSRECFYQDRDCGLGEYHKNFNKEFKRRLRELFNNECLICGKHESVVGTLHCHHVEEGEKMKDPRECLIVPICATCHMRCELNEKQKIKWRNIIKILLEIYYPEYYNNYYKYI